MVLFDPGFAIEVGISVSLWGVEIGVMTGTAIGSLSALPGWGLHILRNVS